MSRFVNTLNIQNHIIGQQEQELQAVKAQLERAENVIRFYSEGYVVDQAEWDDDDDAESVNTWNLYTGKRAREYFKQKEAMNKEKS